MRPSPKVLSQNCPDASTISTRTKPPNAAFSSRLASDTRIAMIPAATTIARAMNSIRL
ncbi:MAG: hypothetical protein FWE35_05705 [Streptosporangiales bacterium]|nr:hypothetical protein [Streptosporangiales bacterium]